MTTSTPSDIATVERALIQGDLAKLSADERLSYYRRICESLGLNPLTQPFAYIPLSGKLCLYARKDATDQLRNLRQVSVSIVSRERIEDVYIVTARATLPSGRTDESTGAVAIGNLKGEALANALMRAETKSKRRVTLSICGLGFLDEIELETLPPAVVEQPRNGHAPALPPPPAEKPAPEKEQRPKRQPPKDGVELQARLAAWEAKAMTKGYCQEGELFKHLTDFAAEKAGVHSKMSDWPPSVIAACWEELQKFAAELKNA